MSHSKVNQLIHIMWSTHNQQHAFSRPLKNDLHAYLTALIKSKNGRVLISGGTADHVHLLIVLPPELSLGGLLNHVKSYSSKWLRGHKLDRFNQSHQLNLSNQSNVSDFNWQSGYLAMSTEIDRLDDIGAYIRGDEQRHASQSYSEELSWMLTKQNINYNEKYLLERSYSKILVHAVWSTNNRTPYLVKTVRHRLYDQMNRVISDCRGVLHEIGGVEDHVHLLIEMPKDKALSDLIQTVKASATHWLKSHSGNQFRDFEWQTGFGGFTVSLSRMESVKHYIQNQEEHHREGTFDDEWKSDRMMLC